jgi:hypothetical protein
MIPVTHFPLAYVGPGAGFAFLGSFLSLVLSLLASVASLLLWPFRVFGAMLRRKRGMKMARVKRVIVVGFDGFDTALAEKLMAEGKLPNLARLRDEGSYRRLRVSSEEEWSTFATGAGEAGARSEPFWKILGRHAVGSTILRVPFTHQPDDFGGRLLSIVDSQDVSGRQGFSLFTKRPVDRDFEHGDRFPLVEADGVLHGELSGPGDEIPFQIQDFAGDHQLEIQGWAYALKAREFTEWIRVKFDGGHRIVRFALLRAGDDFSLYATPLQIDPEKASTPISQPPYYAAYLAKLLGPFATLGSAPDSWAVREGAIDEELFRKLSKSIEREQEAIYLSALDHQDGGVLACVFGAGGRTVADIDRLVGRTLDHARGETAVFVLSSEGAVFSNWKLDAEDPGMEDVAPTVLGLFGIAAPEWMEGKPVIHFA